MTLLLAIVLGISKDCPNLINLAYGLKLGTSQPTIMTQLQTDCCIATGITCVNQVVTVISWGNAGIAMGLTGTINGSAIPSNVTDLFLDTNSITGIIPDISSTYKFVAST